MCDGYISGYGGRGQGGGQRGYLLACVADPIFAAPFAILGSVGGRYRVEYSVRKRPVKRVVSSIRAVGGSLLSR